MMSVGCIFLVLGGQTQRTHCKARHGTAACCLIVQHSQAISKQVCTRQGALPKN